MLGRKSSGLTSDPCPDVPAEFLDHEFVSTLAREIGQTAAALAQEGQEPALENGLAPAVVAALCESELCESDETSSASETSSAQRTHQKQKPAKTKKSHPARVPRPGSCQ